MVLLTEVSARRFGELDLVDDGSDVLLVAVAAELVSALSIVVETLTCCVKGH